MTSPLVLVILGTDVHPFDRLVSWVHGWLVAKGDDAPRCVVQHGTSAAPPAPATGIAFLPHDQLQQMVRDADVVVSHGGPATITECRRSGRLPIVVPRDPALGEHVDGHQQRFARMFAASGLIHLAESEQDLHAALDEAMSAIEAFRVPTRAERMEADAPVPEAVRRIGEVVDRLVATRRVSPEHRARLAAEAAAQRVRVLFVGGLGRSGSTLLERMLGELPEVCAVGEVVHLWERGLRYGERCGCGLPFPECDFWLRVGKEAFDGWDRVDVDQVAELRRAVDRTRHVARTALPWLSPSDRRAVAEYASLYTRVYQAVRAVSGCDIVVDSSKHASLAFVLRWCNEIDLRVLQLVRDSRGVAHSWAKQVRRPDVVDGDGWMAQFGTAKVSLQWTGQNAAFHLLAATGVPVHRERYEDLVADPVATLRRTREFMGLPDDPDVLDFVGDRSVHLQSGHTVSGNPIRFTSGELPLRRDDAWRTELPARRRMVVSAVTLPLRASYGYLGLPGNGRRDVRGTSRDSRAAAR